MKCQQIHLFRVSAFNNRALLCSASLWPLNKQHIYSSSAQPQDTSLSALGKAGKKLQTPPINKVRENLQRLLLTDTGS